MNAEASAKKWKSVHTVLFIALLLLLAIVQIVSWPALYAWFATMLLIVLTMAVIGAGVNGLVRGILIDDRQALSLSRLQSVLWSVVVLGAYMTAVSVNVRAESGDPLAIGIPAELWTVLGISATSLIGSPLVRQPKKNREASKKEAGRTFEIARELNIGSAKTARREGQVVVQRKPADSSIGDLFRGEEVGNWASADIGKLQLFYFTIILVATYALSIGKLFATVDGGITELPALNESFLVLLGISHGSYLGYKAVPHSQTPGVDD